MIKINSIALKGDFPTVRFASLIAEGQWQDSVFPGKGSDDVFPSNPFGYALSGIVEAVQEMDLPDYDWKLQSVAILWDEDGWSGYGVTVKSFNTDTAIKRETTLRQEARSRISPIVERAIDKLLAEAEKFVQGESAQQNLFAQAAEEENIPEWQQIVKDVKSKHDKENAA